MSEDPDMLTQLAALDPATRHEVAEGLRAVAEIARAYRDGRRAGHTLGFLAELVDAPQL